MASNPFPGLRPFQPDEEHLFFGRETEIDDLLRRLRTHRFLAVVGRSGSGKSSLVRSGLIPSLEGGLMAGTGSGWRVVMLRPGENPIGHLAAALDAPGILGVEGEMASTYQIILEATLRRGSLGLASAVRQARLPPGENLLIVVDQFEELFRFRRSRQIAGSRDEAMAFVNLLLEATRDEGSPVHVVLTMRSDFIGDCVEFPGLPEAVNTGMYLVGKMSRDALRSAITGPVAVAGGVISPRLVHRILNDLGDDQDELPLVQHALMRTWDHWIARRERGEADGPMDVVDYEVIGTIAGALSLHAEEAWQEVVQVGSGALAETVFRAITDMVSDSRGVRRPTSLGELTKISGGAEGEVARVVEIFRQEGRAFLMPPADAPLRSSSIIDLSHESLMRCWTRLMGWAEAEQSAAAFYVRLSQAARWHDEGVAGLWRSPEIDLGGRWLEETRPTEAWAERYDEGFERAMAFLVQSRSARAAFVQKRDRERRAKLRKTQVTVGVLAAFLVVAASLTWIARAERARATGNLALARAAVDESLLSAERDPTGMAASVPEFEEFRRELLLKARDFYEEFLNQESRSEEARRDMAMVHVRLGHINRLVNRPEDAVLEYSRGIEQLDALARQYPRRVEYGQALADVYNWLGETLRPLVGRSAEAESAYENALELHRNLVASDPDDPGRRVELARTLYNRGILLWSRNGEPGRVESDFREAVELLVPLSNESPRTAQSTARALNNLAGFLSMEEMRQAEAAALYPRAIEIHEGLLAGMPDNREYQLELAKFSGNLAALLHHLGHSDEAEARSWRAIELVQGLSRLPPVLALERADAHTLRAVILEAGNPLSALGEFQEAMKQFTDMHLDPRFLGLPDFHWRFGDLVTALAAFAERSPGHLEVGVLRSQAVGLYAEVAAAVANDGSEALITEVLDAISSMLPALPPEDQYRLSIVQSGLQSQIGR